MDSGSVKSKLKRGALSGGTRALLAVPVYLLLTPLMARRLGPEQFGIWSFGSILVNVFSFTDFGLTSSLTLHTARDTNSKERVNGYFNTVFWSYLAIAILVLAATLVLAEPVVSRLLKVPSEHQAAAGYVLTIFAAGFGARFVALAFQGVFEGYQEYAYSQLVYTLWLIINAAGTCAILWLSPNLFALGMVSLGGNLFILCAFAWRMRRSFPHVRPQVTFFSTATLAVMMRFGAGILVASLVVAFREPIFKTLVARHYDLSAVAGFEISARLCGQLMALVIAPMGGTFAVSAYLSGNRSELARLIRILFFFVTAVFLPLCLFGQAFGRDLIVWWLGRGYVDAGRIFPAMLTAFSIYYMTEPLYKALEGTGHSRYSAIVQSCSLLAGLAAFFLSAKELAAEVAAYYVAGFVFIALANVLVYRRIFPEAILMTRSEGAWLGAPVALFLLLKSLMPAGLLPFIFTIYLAAHLFALSRVRVVDLSSVFIDTFRRLRNNG